MTKKRNIWISPFLLIGMLLMLTISCTKDDDPAIKKDVVLTWANPADITVGIALSATQLNATADVAGTFVYTPALGTVLSVGANQNLKVDFTPTDAVNYNTATKTVTINVTEINVTKITVTDIDGNVYHTVTIGTQVWMVENLKTTKYRDGTSIPNVTDNTAWSNLTTGAYCDYNNTPSNSSTYGRLYNWYVATNAHNIAPTGWHVPTDADWSTLTTYLGFEFVVGGKLKEIGTTHWQSPNEGATNEAGFTALPGGHRHSNGAFDDIGYYGTWWSATDVSASDAWLRYMYYDYSIVTRDYNSKEVGLSVRCVRD
ncbi:MAG: fibrobacter succinogenes major paralogous domain-containing protein [Candidatus Paceibacterota bacterium]